MEIDDYDIVVLFALGKKSNNKNLMISKMLMIGNMKQDDNV